MCSQETLGQILEQTSARMRELYGSRLKAVILYGSYARGDYVEESDIDIAVLVDASRAQIQQQFKAVSHFVSRLGLEHNVVISPALIPFGEYQKYKHASPYYRAIAREGIVLV